MARTREAGYITNQPPSRNFGLDVKVERSPLPKVNHLPEGDMKRDIVPVFTGYREVIPPGVIGSSDAQDPMLPNTQYIDTVPSYPSEQNDTRLHGAMASLRSADTQSVELKTYGTFQPRTAAMPRAVQDELYLRGPGKNVADPRMTDDDSATMLIPKDNVDRCDLYGKNRDGVLHNPIGEPPAAPKTSAPPQLNNRQVGRGNLRKPHMNRPGELADRPISTAKSPIT